MELVTRTLHYINLIWVTVIVGQQCIMTVRKVINIKLS